MAIPRYERELQQRAGPRFRRFYFQALGVAVLVGFVIGLIWVIAGLINYYVLR